MIPEKALKAASVALERHLPENFGGCAWRCGDDGDDADEHLALVALTAAAPHMLNVFGTLARAGMLQIIEQHVTPDNETYFGTYCSCGTQWPGDTYAEHLANVLTAGSLK